MKKWKQKWIAQWKSHLRKPPSETSSWAQWERWARGVRNKNFVVLEQELRAGIDVDVWLDASFLESISNLNHRPLGSGRRTALGWWAERGDEWSVIWALEHGADPARKDAKGYDPLWRAAMSADPAGPVLKRLIAAGADLNQKHEDTAVSVLMIAAQLGRVDVIHTLLDAGADASLLNPNDERRCDALSCLWESGRDWDAAKVGAWRRLGEMGTAEQRDPTMWVARAAACRNMNADVWAVLEDWARDDTGVWARPDDRGDTPLHRAVACRAVDNVRYLLERHAVHGVDPSCRNVNGDTPMEGLDGWTTLGGQAAEDQQEQDDIRALLVNHERTVLATMAASLSATAVETIEPRRRL